MTLPGNTPSCSERKQILPLYRTHDQEEAKSIFRFLKNEPSSKHRRRDFVFGAFYENIQPGNAYVFDVQHGSLPITMEVILSNGESTLVHIASAASETNLLKRVSCFADFFNTSGNARRNSGDLGDMFALGVRSARMGTIYKPTKDPQIAAGMGEIMRTMASYVRRVHPQTYHDIREAEGVEKIRKLGELGWDNDLCGSMIFTKNLANSGHIDNNDRSKSIAIWTERKPGLAENWYFVLPDVSVDGSKGVMIKLFHGAVVAWDGRQVRHCTSVTTPGDCNSVHSCFFASLGD